jgi:hypothetical protein
MKTAPLRKTYPLHLYHSIIKYVLTYIAYNPLTATLLICIFFILFTIINLTAGDLNLIGVDKLANFFSYFGFIAKENYDINDLLKLISVASLVLMIISIVVSKIAELTTIEVVISSKTKFYFGIGLITVFMLIAQLSTFTPGASYSAHSVWPMLLLFWVISLICYIIYSIIIALVDRLEDYN